LEAFPGIIKGLPIFFLQTHLGIRLRLRFLKERKGPGQPQLIFGFWNGVLWENSLQPIPKPKELRKLLRPPSKGPFLGLLPLGLNSFSNNQPLLAEVNSQTSQANWRFYSGLKLNRSLIIPPL